MRWRPPWPRSSRSPPGASKSSASLRAWPRPKPPTPSGAIWRGSTAPGHPRLAHRRTIWTARSSSAAVRCRAPNRRPCGELPVTGRVLPFAESAVAAGNLTEAELRVVHVACDAVASGFFNDDAPSFPHPLRSLRRQLLFGPQGVVMIDPAADGGHTETDPPCSRFSALSTSDKSSPATSRWRRCGQDGGIASHSTNSIRSPSAPQDTGAHMAPSWWPPRARPSAPPAGSSPLSARP